VHAACDAGRRVGKSGLIRGADTAAAELGDCWPIRPNGCSLSIRTLWVAQSTAGNWVEAGITRGAEFAGGQTTGVEYYWADYRSQFQHPYNEHYDGQYPSYGTYSDIQIIHYTGTEWAVKSGPSLIADSTDNF
jgi:hypothetical protein